MCGISGILYFDPARSVSAQSVRNMSRTLAHRGPDGEGVWIERNVGMAHRRLAIIDLRPEAGQPMCNEDGTVWITFNGEIYNFQELRQDLEARGHQFKTASDTEAIIHAYEEYGRDCLSRLRGMFAFAIWDSRTRTQMAKANIPRRRHVRLCHLGQQNADPVSGPRPRRQKAAVLLRRPRAISLRFGNQSDSFGTGCACRSGPGRHRSFHRFRLCAGALFRFQGGAQTAGGSLARDPKRPHRDGPLLEVAISAKKRFESARCRGRAPVANCRSRAHPIDQRRSYRSFLERRH